ncbi:hypothetical protein DM01DRAFT_320459 [Hesseltinella vesiculosa]|uniref:INO80 complex subunit B-like conserved region domain-containing protein n=1 Tax=Hesseltinella vesiculosa TaxID=101127 RepID=A0A1X2G9F3_9FUNG|nr:hypothetical protein DM01DRAFT_320459 [Hesseltinella vesiculosa]
MTKRQRAKMNREDDDELLELPMDTGKKQLRTQEEEALRRSEVARRRKNQSIQRAEKDKQDTINRLLKKQAGKSKKNEVSEADQPKHKRHHDPHAIRYVQCPQESTLNIPEKLTVDEVFGWQPWDNKRSPKPMETCDVQGCTNIKKYTAKSSGKAVCSLEHYKMVEAK